MCVRRKCRGFMFWKAPDLIPENRQRNILQAENNFFPSLSGNTGRKREDMKNRYWFTDEDGENILDGFCGTEKEAIEYAEKQAEILGENIYVNCGEDIIDVAFA